MNHSSSLKTPRASDQPPGQYAADAPPTQQRRSRRPRRSRLLATEPVDEPQVEPRYCPTERRFKSKEAFDQHRSDETSCERMLVEVKNSSGAIINVFRVNSDGHEVRISAACCSFFLSPVLCMIHYSPPSASLSSTRHLRTIPNVRV